MHTIHSNESANAPAGDALPEDPTESQEETTKQDELLLEVSGLQTKLKDTENKYLYLYAEFENYKKRAIKERSDWIKFGWENVARELLVILDNMERALGSMTQSTDPQLKAGLDMVLKHFQTTLEKQNVQPIHTLGLFNPELHEALSIIPSESVQNGHILETVSKGYTLHGRLLRAAKVVVSSGPKISTEGTA